MQAPSGRSSSHKMPFYWRLLGSPLTGDCSVRPMADINMTLGWRLVFATEQSRVCLWSQWPVS